MHKEHQYSVTLAWTGNNGIGTSSYRSYERSYTVTGDEKPTILGSSDPVFRGDKTRYNPEELLLAALSGCHMLMYLHLCAESGVIVIDYKDEATGHMQETPDGGGHFTEVILHPSVTVTESSMIEMANNLHQEANRRCFIARSCNFPVRHRPVTCSAGDRSES